MLCSLMFNLYFWWVRSEKRFWGLFRSELQCVWNYPEVVSTPLLLFACYDDRNARIDPKRMLVNCTSTVEILVIPPFFAAA